MLTRSSKCRCCSDASPYRTAEWRALSDQVVTRDRECLRCGSTLHLQAHHVIPRVHGGPDHPSNLATLCASCHRLETVREQVEERRYPG